MATPFTHLNLANLDDAAPANGFGERWEARVAREPLGAEQPASRTSGCVRASGAPSPTGTVRRRRST